MAEMMKFDTNEAGQVQEKLTQSAEGIEDILLQVGNILNSVDEWWKGESVRAYMQQYDRIKTPVEGLIEAVRTISEQIAATIEDKNTQEQELSSILSQSFN